MRTGSNRGNGRGNLARRTVVMGGLLLLLSLLPGCGAFKGISNTIDESTDKTVAVLDEAIVDLADESADWQIVLQDTIAQLTDETQQTLRNDITNLLRRAPAVVGAEFRCDVDFVRLRVRQDLIRIRASLLGIELEPKEPTFCSVVPLAVDAALVPSDLNLVEFYGYDFDTTPVQVLMRNGNQDIDVSSFLDRPTHYHMTLNLGGNGVQLSPDSQRFVLRWNDQEISTIAVIQPATPVCGTETREFKPAAISYLPPHTRGDREYSGNGPRVTASVELVYTDTSVNAVVTMTAEETKSDWTTASGSETFTLYTPDPGFKIQQIVGEVNSSFNYIDSDHEDDVFAGSGPVASYTFSGDDEGSDAGVHTAVTMTFNQIRVELIEDKNCVSPLAVRMLELQLLISPATLNTLTPQIGTVQINPDLQQRLEPQLENPLILNTDVFTNP
ncbi:MAG: hypothetical protein L0332_19355 [Chloroflexi bacterium]|nr:hypothetical protein [Chloroflexota bacterium]MCI0649269.1 hypothetical protein [Chloroflexota bacterium]MCI0728853.1 hypothetical protein [Chloroflexota bacterium]